MALLMALRFSWEYKIHLTLVSLPLVGVGPLYLGGTPVYRSRYPFTLVALPLVGVGTPLPWWHSAFVGVGPPCC